MKWLIALFVILFVARWVGATADPLGAQFQPSIDTNPNDYATAFGTITITDSLYKVFKSSTAPGALHWFSGTSAYMMKNEILSFQIHASPSVNITSYTVTVSNLTNAQTGTVISSSTADIIVYREFYMAISTPSSIGTSYYNVRKSMPDQLIPATEPYWHQTTNAFPVAITSGNTQSVWVDVHAATSVPSGFYQGSVYVSSGNVVVSTMPVVIGVWNWIMPSSTTLGGEFSGFEYDGMCTISYGGTTNCGNYPNAGGSDNANTLQWIDGARQLLDNRYGIYNPANAAIYPDISGTVNFTNYTNHILPLLNGTTTAVLPGASLTEVALQVSTNAFSPLAPTAWQAWADTSTNQGWNARLNDKICDEPPNGCSWAALIAVGTTTRHLSTPIVPNMVTVDSATANENGALYAIDWITPIIGSVDNDGTGINNRAGYDFYLSQSSGTPRKIGSYQDCESAGHNGCTNSVIGDAHGTYPNRHIDGLPVANRAFETWAFKNRIAYEHYFDMDFCDVNNCPAAVNPWVSVYAFGANGDGTLMYASTGTYVTTSLNIPIWIPSIRLKHIRDGFQDYEYENYLTNKGFSAVVNAQIGTWMTNGYTFSTDPATFQAARYAMGQAIHQLTYPVVFPVLRGGKLKRGVLK